MATKAICGFETGDAAESRNGTGMAGTGSIQSTITTGAWSAYAYRCNPTTTGTGSFVLGGRAVTGGTGTGDIAASTVYTRFKFRPDTLPAANNEVVLWVPRTGGGDAILKWEMRIDSSGNLSVYDSTPTLIATGTIVLSVGNFYRIEVKVGSGAGAVVEWYVATGNGTAVLDVSTTATLNSAANGNHRFGKHVNRNGNTVVFYYDDIRISDSAYPGAGNVTCLLPNANGNYQTWTIGAGSGSHYQNVNERPPDGSTSYLKSDLVAGDAETEALTDSGTAGITGTVNCVMSCAIMKEDSVLTGGTCNIRLRSGSTDSDTPTTTTVTASWVLLGKLYDTDPATSAAWVVSALDSVETGALGQGVVNPVWMTWTGAMVDYTPAAASGILAPLIIHSQAVNRAEFY